MMKEDMNNNASVRYVISRWITPQTIELKMRATNRDMALQELVSKVPDIAHQPAAKQILYRALQEREQLCSTGVGDGVAIPHARNALVGLVDHPVIVFGRHETGINFGSIDGQPAKLFFLLVAPTVRDHLQLLARLSKILRDPKVRQDLMKAETVEKVISIIRDAEQNL
jgi:mannitol/fructose-specific phosphotransferase system IIA component (Ntr-type)